MKPLPADYLRLMGRVKEAFQAPYVGDADERFRRYLARCCVEYRADPSKYSSPDVTLTQSSGFGKSRLVYNLAQKTAGGATEEAGGTTFGMRVLYVCARSNPYSSGYPVATKLLRARFLDKRLWESDIVARLVEAFQYARRHWDAVGSEWAKLFVDESADLAVVHALISSHSQEAPQKKRETLSVTPVLVFAVDEARSLLEMNVHEGVSSLCLLRRALIKANARVKDEGAIFAVLIDTNPKIHDLAPAWPSSRSSGRIGTAKTTFPLFVLTHTYDVLLTDPASREPFDYEANVATTGEDDGEWTALVLMGRPLWESCNRGYISSLVDFAASKLLLGMSHINCYHYTDETMHGVASLFCRLGLRLNSGCDVFAARMAANFMGVLQYVNHTNEARITGYVSEPILALGATRMWHQLDPPALQQFVLPRFEEMLVQGAVDTTRIGAIVARVFLLLAMDMTVKQTFNPKNYGLFTIYGQLCSVSAYLKVLYGSSPAFIDVNGQVFSPAEPSDTTVNLDTWVAGWKDWKVGFFQFVELPKVPTKKTLWFLLGRRAAGVLPPTQAGAELVIPIFCGHEVSFVLVHVTNKVDSDEKFAKSVSSMLTAPMTGLEASSHGTIRLFMSLRGCSAAEPPQCIVVSEADAEDPHAKTYAVALRGMCRSPRQHEDMAPTVTELWPFLSSEVSSQLERIARAPCWDAMDEVRMDLERRDKAEGAEDLRGVLSADELRQSAERSLHAVPF